MEWQFVMGMVRDQGREGEAVALSRDYRNGERSSSMLLEKRIQPRDHHLVTVQSGRLASHDPQVCRGYPVGMRGHPPKGLSGSWCFRGQINACGKMKGARNTQGRKDVILGDEKHHKVRGNVRIPAMILGHQSLVLSGFAQKQSLWKSGAARGHGQKGPGRELLDSIRRAVIDRSRDESHHDRDPECGKASLCHWTKPLLALRLIGPASLNMVPLLGIKQSAFSRRNAMARHFNEQLCRYESANVPIKLRPEFEAVASGLQMVHKKCDPAFYQVEKALGMTLPIIFNK
jgi:hypothetical protein